MFKIIKKIRKLPKKVLIIGVIIILVLGYLLVFKNSKSPVSELVTAEIKNLKQQVLASGTLSGKNSVDLHFKSGGKLAYINVGSEDSVKQGEVIAGLDTQELSIALRQAENTLRDKRAIVDKIKDDLKDVSEESYTQRQTRTTAEVAQDNAYDSVLAAKRAFQDAVMIAPINGIIAKADVVSGEVVSPTDIIVRIVDFSGIVFEAEVDEADIGKVKLSQKADITLNAYGEKVLKGVVMEISPQAETTSNGATIVIVKILLSDQLVKNIVGLNGQVDITTSEKNTLSIPIDSLQDDNSVLIMSKDGPKKQKVEVGIMTDTEVEILKGLKEGDRIIVNAADFAKTK
ncbi:MAG: efflux RND transporter periplasmic adaptor subunit [Candidatus Levybacteria bacterium]|nr:efflux RND transporter periplasmic adaptor subunit [Candidatus Levybacteria bacterium]